MHTLVVFGPGKTRKTSEFTSCVSERLDEILSEASLKLYRLELTALLDGLNSLCT